MAEVEEARGKVEIITLVEPERFDEIADGVIDYLEETHGCIGTVVRVPQTV